MKLIIDIGNTLCKLAVFKEDTLVEVHKIVVQELLPTLNKIEELHQISSVIVSSVGKIDVNSIENIKNKYPTLVLTKETKVNFKNLYKSKSTLGIDRIALVAASQVFYPNKNVLIIDAGTCITYDFVNEKAEYFGGAISPGIQLRYNALKDYTAKLPRLEKIEDFKLIGDDTASSIHSGVLNGVLHEIDGQINEYRKKYGDLTIVLTGGDINYLSKQLKNSIFAHQNFILYGLNSILTLNNN